jgi:hypothetical protein
VLALNVLIVWYLLKNRQPAVPASRLIVTKFYTSFRLRSRSKLFNSHNLNCAMGRFA